MKEVVFLLFFTFPIFLVGQQLSKKELRELRKQEKVIKTHQKLKMKAKDTIFTLYLPSMNERTHYGKDEAIFNFSKTLLTLYNVVMPVTDDEHMEKIPSYITRILTYDVDESPSGALIISSSFQYSKWKYSMVVEKSRENNLVVAKFYVRGALLGTYEGKMKP